MDTASAAPAWRDRLAALRFLAARVAQVHGDAHPPAATLAQAVEALHAAADGDRAAQAALAHRIGALTDGFRPWPEACPTVARLYAGLAAVVAALPPAQPA